MKKIQIIKNTEATVLQSKDVGNGNRLVFIFTKDYGNQAVFVSKSVVKTYGGGVLMPFSKIKCSLAFEKNENKISMIQYEGEVLFDIGQCTYEDLCKWCYLIEILKLLFPPGEKDVNAYLKLCQCLNGSIEKNKEISAFITTIQMLCVAGYDPSYMNTQEICTLSQDSEKLLKSFVKYTWKVPMGINISRKKLKETAIYLDKFIEIVCGITLKTKGAFV